MQNEKLKQAIAEELRKQQTIGIKEVLDSFSYETEDGGYFYWAPKVKELKEESSILFDGLPQDEQQCYLDKAEKLIMEASSG